MKKCPKCSGTGKVVDPADIGMQYQRKRLAKSLTLREVAAAMNPAVSISFLSDLEHGRRNWNKNIEKRFLCAIGEG